MKPNYCVDGPEKVKSTAVALTPDPDQTMIDR